MGLTYSDERFQKNFGDYIEQYGIRDMYASGFYPFETLEEYWAWWSRRIVVDRYPITKLHIILCYLDEKCGNFQ